MKISGTMERKLFLIDGHSLIFRMYYAFLRHPMINSSHEDVSILYGFTKYLLELIRKYSPTHLAVCFDPPGKTFRHQMFPEYKGTRQATPELVIESLEPLTGICKALGFPVLMRSGFEGDDVLGSMAVRCASEGFKVYMVTPDKDFGQLISADISQLKPGKAGGEDEIWTPETMKEKFGVDNPAQFIDILSIMGDTADNVPGVDGVGEVGAAKLVCKYGSLENIYAHLDELTPKQKALFEAARDHMDLSKALVTIKTDIPLDEVSESDMLIREEHPASVAEIFARYEFPSLMKYIRLAEGEIFSPAKGETLEWKEVEPARLSSVASAEGRCAVVFDADGDGIFAPVRSMVLAVCTKDGSFVSQGSVADFAEVLRSNDIVKTGYDLKLLDNLLDCAGVRLGGRLDDLALMHYLLDPEKSHKIDVLSRTYINVSLEDEAEPSEPAPSPGLFDDPVDVAADEKPRFKEAVAVYKVSQAVMEDLRREGMMDLFSTMEEPLERVLASMERAGVKVDLGSLKDFADSLREELSVIEGRVRKACGIPDLNVASVKQVGTMLFEVLRIDPKMKIRSGRYSYPTDEDTLMGYAEKFPIIYDILEYRTVLKLLNTYIEPFGGWISPRDGRIHTTFNQALTATGRLSSSRPNLQNIPIRTERGRLIRQAFVASDPSKVIVSADYSQIELRLMAHFCGDRHLCEAFCAGTDVHAVTASKIFGVPVEEVTAEMRRTAKTANFGIMYGISAFGLAQRLRIPLVAAKKIIEDYFTSFPAIAQWVEKIKEDAARQGYVQTLFGRRRYLPDINSRNATVRSLAQRNAINAPIQGTAADIIKMAMIRVDRSIRNAALESRMILQIHDELVFEAPSGEVERLMTIIKEEMENVMTLSVPLTVECNYGENWLQAH